MREVRRGRALRDDDRARAGSAGHVAHGQPVESVNVEHLPRAPARAEVLGRRHIEFALLVLTQPEQVQPQRRGVVTDPELEDP